MSRDLSAFLNAWPFVQGTISARRIKGRDGLPKVQLRVDLGVLQMEATGRPDGKQPLGHPTWLHALKDRLDTRDQPQRDGIPLLTPDECNRLHQEAIQFHHRSIAFFHLKDMEPAAADCAHNLGLFNVLNDHAPSREAAWPSLQLAPQQTLLHARARAACLKPSQHAQLVQLLGESVENLGRFFEGLGRPEWAEACPEIAFLRGWRQQAEAGRPMSELEQLGHQLADAIHREDYEQAARLRDQIKRLGNG